MTSQPQAGPPASPTMSRRTRWIIGIVVGLLVLLFIGSRLLSTYIDWLLFGELGFRSVFSTVLLTRLALGVTVAVVLGGVLALNLLLAYRTRPVFVPVSGPDDPLARYRTAVAGRLRTITIAIGVISGALAGMAAQGSWQRALTFLNSTPFGRTDPEFGFDISFWAFELPFYSWMLNWLLAAVAVGFVGAAVTHYLYGGIRFSGKGGTLTGPARVQLAVLAGLFVLLKAFGYVMDRYRTLNSTRSDIFTGATYTDLNAVLPGLLILTCIAVFCAIAFFVGAALRNLQLPAIATALMLLSSILVGGVWPALLEQFSVRPNAIEKESESIERNIAATREAYGITDEKVNYEDYPGVASASPSEIKQNKSTIPNVRLLDPTILTPTYDQLQGRENFYGFPEKLDMDRYSVDGRKQDFIVGLREMDTSALAGNQNNWLNRHLRYTHGNGFVAAPANKVNSALRDETGSSSGDSGYPVFTVSDSTQQGTIKVKQPRVYYGELISDYSIVQGNQKKKREYDVGDQRFSYDGSGGVPVGGWVNRAAFAANFQERNILFSSSISDDSRIMFQRDPRDRVKKAAPWLTVDGDPYPTVVDGRIKWVIDGYTTLQSYPYAQRTTLGEATADSLNGVSALPDKEIRYIRNSVKATVDAYTGKVSLYAFDESDPVLQTYMKAFPDTIKPKSAISDDLRQHFRYPQDLFKVQREMLSRYHVSDPATFFEQNEFWQVPSDPTSDGDSQQPPYYVLASAPGQDGTTFQITSALNNLRRENLGAWVSASSKPSSYGDITVLQLPTDTQTQGPAQVQRQFNSNDRVNSDRTLFDNANAEAVYGNLLTLPLSGGFLYVEPLYIQQKAQDNQSVPQLARVLVSYGGSVGFAPTLAEALDQVFGDGAGNSTTKPGDEQGGDGNSESSSPSTPSPDGSGNDSGGDTASPQMQQAVSDIQSALQQVREAQSSGNFEELGQAYQQLDEATKRFEQAQQGGGGSEDGG